MINIRPVKEDEWEKLRDLNKLIFVNNPGFDDDLIVDFADTEIGKNYFKEAILSNDGICLVAEEDGGWVGYINGSHKPIPYRHSRYFEIENLGVIPKVKGKGVGKKLLQAITDWAKENNYQKIYVETYIKNEEAVEFYRNHGYKEIDLSLEKVI